MTMITLGREGSMRAQNLKKKDKEVKIDSNATSLFGD